MIAYAGIMHDERLIVKNAQSPQLKPVDFSPGFEYTEQEGGAVESPLALYLLGPPRIERDGVPVKLDRRKAIALVAYLAVTGQSHRRDSLVNLLWPEYDSSRGRAALRRTLYALRDTLGS